MPNHDEMPSIDEVLPSGEAVGAEIATRYIEAFHLLTSLGLETMNMPPFDDDLLLPGPGGYTVEHVRRGVDYLRELQAHVDEVLSAEVARHVAELD